MSNNKFIVTLILIITLISISLVGCGQEEEPANQNLSMEPGNNVEPAKPHTNINEQPEPTEPPKEKFEDRTLLTDIEKADVIAWIAPHPDDDLFATALLAQASLNMKKTAYVISLHNKGGVAFPPGAGPEDRFQDNKDFRDLTGLKDYLYADFTKYPRNKETATKAYLVDIVKELDIDLIITFENTNGAYGHKEHIQVSGWITEFAKENDVKLYYVINRDPAVSIGKVPSLDPLPFTDTLNLNEMRVTKTNGEKMSLWDLKLEALEVYKSSVPMVVRLLDSPDLKNNLVREELYRKVN